MSLNIIFSFRVLQQNQLINKYKRSSEKINQAYLTRIKLDCQDRNTDL